MSPVKTAILSCCSGGRVAFSAFTFSSWSLAKAFKGNRYSAHRCSGLFKIISNVGTLKLSDFPEEVGVVIITSFPWRIIFRTSICENKIFHLFT